MNEYQKELIGKWHNDARGYCDDAKWWSKAAGPDSSESKSYFAMVRKILRRIVLAKRQLHRRNDA